MTRRTDRISVTIDIPNDEDKVKKAKSKSEGYESQAGEAVEEAAEGMEEAKTNAERLAGLRGLMAIPSVVIAHVTSPNEMTLYRSASDIRPGILKGGGVYCRHQESGKPVRLYRDEKDPESIDADKWADRLINARMTKGKPKL